MHDTAVLLCYKYIINTTKMLYAADTVLREEDAEGGI